MNDRRQFLKRLGALGLFAPLAKWLPGVEPKPKADVESLDTAIWCDTNSNTYYCWPNQVYSGTVVTYGTTDTVTSTNSAWAAISTGTQRGLCL